MNTIRGDHAIVLGASIAGLLAARVLADHYRTVTVVERDVLPDQPVTRRGVPQGRQPHVLAARGAQILDELFPGILAELIEQGVPARDDGALSRLHVSIGGHLLVHHDILPAALVPPVYYPSRPLLEWNVRRRLAGLDNVTILSGHELLGFTATPDGTRVTGARIADGTPAERTLTADLVVDATGRGSRTPVFLEQLGYPRPPEDELVVRLAYASQPMRLPAGAIHEDLIGIFPEPGRPWAFACVGYENDVRLVCVGAMAGTPVPDTRTELLSRAAQIAPAEVVAALAAAEPLGDVAQYRVPSNRWRRYDRMRRFPRGLLVIGDAMCSFNPIYGQGMTVAAIESLVLRDCLRHGDQDRPHRFFRTAARKIRLAWQTAVGADLALPEVDGPRPLSMRLSNAFMDWVLTAAETDPLVALQIHRVTSMIDPPSRLLRPGFLARVARRGRERPAEPRRIDLATTRIG